MAKTRYELIDALRAIAVILMVIFHFCFDLTIFNFYKVNFVNHPFWVLWPPVIIGLFLTSVGLGLAIEHEQGIKWPRFFKRFFKIAFCAFLISLASFIFVKDKWIYFGILHNIAISSLLALPFLKRPRLSLVFSVLIFVPIIFFNYEYSIVKLSHLAIDRVDLFPWFSFVLLGIYLKSVDFHKRNVPDHFAKKNLLFLGRNSLTIYLLHQVILYPFIAIARTLYDFFF